jgi:hypothetical protein
VRSIAAPRPLKSFGVAVCSGAFHASAFRSSAIISTATMLN